MKTLQSIIEGTWIEVKPIFLTEEQKVLLASTDNQVKIELMAEIKSQREVKASNTDKQFAVTKYNEVKPTLKETDIYEFISADIVINETATLGILNCRVNGEHKQIRF